MREGTAAILYLVGGMLVLVSGLSIVSWWFEFELEMEGTPIPADPWSALAFLVVAAFFGGLALLLDRWPRLVAWTRAHRGAAASIGLALVVGLAVFIHEAKYLNRGGRLPYAAYHGDIELLNAQIARGPSRDELTDAMRTAFYADQPDAVRVMREAGADADGFFAGDTQRLLDYVEVQGLSDASRALVLEYAPPAAAAAPGDASKPEPASPKP